MIKIDILKAILRGITIPQKGIVIEYAVGYNNPIKVAFGFLISGTWPNGSENIIISKDLSTNTQNVEISPRDVRRVKIGNEPRFSHFETCQFKGREIERNVPIWALQTGDIVKNPELLVPDSEKDFVLVREIDFENGAVFCCDWNAKDLVDAAKSNKNYSAVNFDRLFRPNLEVPLLSKIVYSRILNQSFIV